MVWLHNFHLLFVNFIQVSCRFKSCRMRAPKLFLGLIPFFEELSAVRPSIVAIILVLPLHELKFVEDIGVIYIFDCLCYFLCVVPSFFITFSFTCSFPNFAKYTVTSLSASHRNTVFLICFSCRGFSPSDTVCPSGRAFPSRWPQWTRGCRLRFLWSSMIRTPLWWGFSLHPWIQGRSRDLFVVVFHAASILGISLSGVTRSISGSYWFLVGSAL